MKTKLNELTIENVDAWPSAIKIMVVGLIFFIIVFLGYWFDTSTQLTHLKSLKLQQQTLLQDIQINYIQAANVGAYQQQLIQINDIFKELLRKLPTSSEVPGLLDDISKTGIANGLTFVLFKPGQEKKQRFYAELPIEISVIGNYHQLGKFVSEIEGLDRIVTLNDFSITPVPSQDPQKQLLFTVTAKTYRYIEKNIISEKK